MPRAPKPDVKSLTSNHPPAWQVTMNTRRLLLTAFALAALGGLVSDRSIQAQGISGLFGDGGSSAPAPKDKDANLFSGASASSSSMRQTRMTVAELRQARALARANQRTARLEYNLWMQREPLRPNWNAVPMMSSRYPVRRIYIPIYVPAR